jgi:starch phosphorylase
MTSTQQPSVAYFCMEYGLETALKIYCGGLGILAGDTLKGAKDNNLPLVGIGLKWKQGYTEQRIDGQGKAYDCYHNFQYPELKDTGVKVTVKIRQNDVACKVWLCDAYKNAPLYLLDTDLPENADKWITGQLYGWFGEERIAQEIVLGVGGVRALQALGHKVDVYHFNEGHAALAGLELIRQKMNQGQNFDAAWQQTRQQIVFTTHTPIKEGNEHHNHELLQYMGANLGLSIEQLNRVGGTPFNMTVAGLRLSRNSNAVAQLHAETAKVMWSDVSGRSSIIGITNGIHVPTWVDERMRRDFSSTDALWTAHQEVKKDTIQFIKQRSGVQLNPDSLLIGFSRRAAPYKRSNLIFAYENQLGELLKTGKVQIVFSGKAHPLDDTGKAIVHNLVQMSRQYPNSVVFLENYDMDIGRALTRGCDVWLNNPRRPLEACGTSGMKAAMNGVLNVSILDGWWPEACKHGENGWAIGDEHVPPNVGAQDERDALALYKILVEEVIPTYYNDRNRWLKMMKASIESCTKEFSVDRMLREYYENLYKAPAQIID